MSGRPYCSNKYRCSHHRHENNCGISQFSLDLNLKMRSVAKDHAITLANSITLKGLTSYDKFRNDATRAEFTAVTWPCCRCSRDLPEGEPVPMAGVHEVFVPRGVRLLPSHLAASPAVHRVR